MPKKVIITTKTNLENTTAPSGVVSHKDVISYITAELAAKGYTINKEVYIQNLNGTTATGIYHLDKNKMITWTNTYDGTMSFKCETGAYIASNDSYVIGEDLSNYTSSRADDVEVKVSKHIKAQVSTLDNQIAKLIKDIDLMKNSNMTDIHLAHVIGVLYFKENLINSSQLIKIKKAYDGSSNMWDIYRTIGVNLKDSHPKSWISQQQGLYVIMMNEFAVGPECNTLEEIADPNQMSLLDEIEAVSQQEVVEEDKGLTLESHPGYIEPVLETEEEVVVSEIEVEKEPEGLTLNSYKAKDFTEEELAELNDSDTDSSDAILPEVEQNQTIEDTFPTPPVNIPVYTEAIPLEEQVAGEYVEPVTEAEVEVSAAPIVDEPVMVDNVIESDPQPVEEDPELDFLNDGPTEDPIFTPEPKSENNVIPNFEF